MEGVGDGESGRSGPKSPRLPPSPIRRQRIRTAIALLGSQAKLADACGVTQASVWQAKEAGRVSAELALLTTPSFQTYWGWLTIVVGPALVPTLASSHRPPGTKFTLSAFVRITAPP